MVVRALRPAMTTNAVPPTASVFCRELRHTFGRRRTSRACVHFRRGRHLGWERRSHVACCSESSWEVDETGGVVFTVNELVAVTFGELFHQGSPGSVCTDTRVVRPGQWFLALSGDTFDGDEFAHDALSAGCAGVVSCRPPPENWTAGWVRVEDTTHALQSLASIVRNKFKGVVVGITGSVGKTTVRELCALALGDETHSHVTKSNFNNHIGVPLTILKAPPDAKVWVLEMGMSAPGEIATLVSIARPTIRVVTNVAPAHLNGVRDVDGVAAAKAEMFANAVPGDVCVLNADDHRVMAMRIPTGCVCVSFGGVGSGADVMFETTQNAGDDDGEDEVFAPNEFRLRDKKNAETINVSLSQPGAHLAQCTACASAIAVVTGMPLTRAGARMESFTSPNGRSRVSRNAKFGITVLDDAYNASPKSVASAFATLRNAKDRGHRTVALLGDMLELGSASHGLHVETLTLCLDARFDVVGVAGEAFSAAATTLAATRPDAAVVVVATDAEALWETICVPATATGSVVLVKGSRGMGMERIVRRLVDE